MVKNILPPGTSVVVVFENDCNPSFTYLLDGPNTTYVGRGALHNPKYEGWGREMLLNDLDLSQYFTGVPINSGYCPFSIRVYPSEAMEAQYRTTQPAILTGAAVLIAAFVSFIL